MSTKRILLETSTGRLSLAQGTTTIGRSRSCGIRLEDLSASRNHALLSREGDRVMVKDLDSSNGTFLNGERLEREVELRAGDVIQIGESELRLAVIEEATGVGSETVYAAGELSTRYVPRPGVSLPSSSEAVAVGDALAVGEVLAQSKPAWKSTGVLPMAEPTPASPTPRPAPPVPPPGGPVRAAAAVVPKAANPESAELLPSIDDIERQLAAQERSTKPPQARSSTARLQPAGFFRRLFAQWIDGALLLGVALAASFVGGGPLEPSGSLVMTIAAPLLGVLLHVGGWMMGGASPGKKLLGLVVCDDKGRVGLSLGRALLRYLGYIASSIPLGAGFLIPLFHPQKKALHDLIAGTYVGRR